MKAHVMGLPGSHRLHDAVLWSKKGTESATNSCYRITSMQCFSKLRPELIYIYTYLFTFKLPKTVPFTSFLKPWMLDNTSGFYLQLFYCNILQIFNLWPHLLLGNRCLLSPSTLIGSFHTDTLL